MVVIVNLVSCISQSWKDPLAFILNKLSVLKVSRVKVFPGWKDFPDVVWGRKKITKCLGLNLATAASSLVT